MTAAQGDPIQQMETTCGTLLYELQVFFHELATTNLFKIHPFFILILQFKHLSFFSPYLKVIWDEVGESDTERDKMLYELERECLEVYRRKVDEANKSRAQLRQAIADAEAELAAICSAMGERPVHIRQVWKM